MRGKTGERVALFNGRDGEWMATIAALERRQWCALTVVERLRQQVDEVGPLLAFAPIRGARVDFVGRPAPSSLSMKSRSEA